ncbi:MAG: hypothetical protein RBR68_13325 [Tenuifilaceae bacterium]|nr:hypothetical protein [Tenuifilaceae bacterium]
MNISDFTQKTAYTKMREWLFSHDLVLDVNGVTIPISNAEKAEKLAYPNAVEPGKKITLDEYCPPSSVVLDTYQRISLEIEKSVQCAFLLQMFNIKGTDLLCAAFCFIISLLPCSARNDLYLATQAISEISSSAVTGARAVNDLANTVIGVADTAGNIASTVGNMFSDEKSSNGVTNQDISNAEKVAVMLAAPKSIVKNIELILKAMQLSRALNFLNPDFLSTTLWDLAQNILCIVQSIVLQAVDEALNKIVQPIEKMLKDLVPGICFGTMADAIRQKIIQFIRSIKSRLLSEIADLFQSHSSYNLKFRANQKQCGWTVELLSFITVVNYILQNFVAIARACGVSPCRETGYSFKPSDFAEGGPYSQDDSINPFSYYTPDEIKTISEIPDKINNIDDLSDKLSELTNTGTIVTPDKIESVYEISDNAPKYILDLIQSGILNNILDSNYGIYNDINSKKIVFTFNKVCGD